MLDVIRRRLTFSNLLALVALFIVIGGSAYAGAKLAKNSVGAKQIKKNAVSAQELKANAVTGDKVKDRSLNGTDIDLGSLGQVPSAANATNATKAVDAANAANAAAVDGQSVTNISAKLNPGQLDQLIVTAGGFRLTASCLGNGNDVDLTLDPPNETAQLTVVGNGSAGPVYNTNGGGEPNDIRLDGTNAAGVSTFAGTLSDGSSTVSGTVGYEDPDTFKAENVCAIYGHVISG